MRKIEKFNKLHSLLNVIEEQENKNFEEKNLLEAIFSNSPIPMAAWSICREGKVLVQKGNGIINHDSLNLKDLFEGHDGFERLVAKHTEAFEGNQADFIHVDKDRTFQIKLIPMLSESFVDRVMGIAIDVTSIQSKTFYSDNDVTNKAI